MYRKVLKDNGYSATAFHGFRESFWNRNVIYPKYGFDNFYGQKSYQIDENIGLGLSDECFFNQSLTKIKELKEPYYALLITLSSHFPYDDTEKYDEFNYKNYLKNNHLDIFEEELYATIRDTDLWPQKRDFKTYNEWFDTQACDTVFDLSNEPIEIEEF